MHQTAGSEKDQAMVPPKGPRKEAPKEMRREKEKEKEVKEKENEAYHRASDAKDGDTCQASARTSKR